MDPQQKIVCAAFYIVMVIIFIAVLLSPNDRFNIWASRKLDQFVEGQQKKRQAKDEADPSRVARREKCKKLYDRAGIYALFFTATVLLPIGNACLAIQQLYVNGEPWFFLFFAVVQGSFGVFIAALNALSQEDCSTEQKDPNS